MPEPSHTDHLPQHRASGHDRFGGEICRAINPGVPHHCNRLNGIEVDLTRNQFELWVPEAAVVAVGRDDLASSGPTVSDRYERLVAEMED